MKTKSEPPAAAEFEFGCDAWRRAVPAIAPLLADAAALALENASGRVAVLLSDDAAVRQLNARYRTKDKPTNVLSFPAPKEFPDRLGDIVLAFETVAAEAATQGKPLADHARHLLVHGILHLLGHNHEDPRAAEAMETKERAILARLGVPDPYAA